MVKNSQATRSKVLDFELLWPLRSRGVVEVHPPHARCRARSHCDRLRGFGRRRHQASNTSACRKCMWSARYCKCTLFVRLVASALRALARLHLKDLPHALAELKFLVMLARTARLSKMHWSLSFPGQSSQVWS